MAAESEILISSEYSAVRAEIATQLGQIHALELGAIGAVGAVWTWLFSHPSTPAEAWWVPVALVFLGSLKVLLFYRSIDLAGAFIKSREEAISIVAGQVRPKIIGEACWESYRRSRSAGLVIGACFFWFLLLGATIAVGFWRNSSSWSAHEVGGEAISLKCVSDGAGTSPGILLKCAPSGGD